jgi:hypothetical protein
VFNSQIHTFSLSEILLPLPPAGYSLVSPSRGDPGVQAYFVLVTADRWQRGTVARICAPSAAGVLRVVAYLRQTSMLRGTVDTLLDAASCGQCWGANFAAVPCDSRARPSAEARVSFGGLT